MKPHIQYFSEDVDYNIGKKNFSKWLIRIATEENKNIGELNYIFCSDQYLHRINLKYLNHDNFTDIITFPYVDKDILSGDIFISIERVRENAIQYEVSFDEELLRVMAHGLLHLMGYRDKTDHEQTIMRNKENLCISLFKEKYHS